MKTFKSILIAATLICASASMLSAQEAAQPAQGHQWKVAIGDSVKIKPECQEYLTGETPSSWVWDKIHTVRQLGTKRFPEGVLLMNIYSWICEDCLVPAGQTEEEAAQAAKGQKTEVANEAPNKAKEAVAPTKAEQAQTAPAEAAAASAAAGAATAAAAGTTAEQAAEQAAAQPAAQPAEGAQASAQEGAQEAQPAEAAQEAAPAAEQAAEQPAEQPAAEAAQPTEQAAAEGDPIRTKQNFDHNYHRFTIGVRGGAASLLHETTNGHWACGGEGVLDLQYAHYWSKDGRPVDLGLITGIGIGYSQSGMNANVDTYKQISDPTSGKNIDYTVHVDNVNERDGVVVLEIPLMFSLIHESGFFFNVGPRFMLPVYLPYTQTLSNNANTYISAFFEETGVLVSNEVITGLLKETDYTTKGSPVNPVSFNLLLGAELGYEWTLKNGNSLGLGVYGNYGVYHSFTNNTTDKSLVEVTPPTDSDVAAINVHSATSTYANKLGYFGAGIKLAYHFNFPKKNAKNYRAQKLF